MTTMSTKQTAITERQQALKPFRARARALGFTIETSRCGGYFLNYRDDDEWQYIDVNGFEELEQTLADLDRAIPQGPNRKPTGAVIAQARRTVREWRRQARQAIEDARPVLPCAFCSQMRNGEDVYRVGPVIRGQDLFLAARACRLWLRD